MIELRWVLIQDGHGVQQDVKTLQCRMMANFMEYGMQEPIWSPWFDVPTVMY